jgi:hypothetical protein
MLSTKLDAVEDNLDKDGVGLALEWGELEETIRRWIQQPSLAQPYKAASRRLSGAVRTSFFVDEWLDPVLRRCI